MLILYLDIRHATPIFATLPRCALWEMYPLRLTMRDKVSLFQGQPAYQSAPQIAYHVELVLGLRQRPGRYDAVFCRSGRSIHQKNQKIRC